MGTGEFDRDEAVLVELADGEVDCALQVIVAGNRLSIGEGNDPCWVGDEEAGVAVAGGGTGVLSAAEVGVEAVLVGDLDGGRVGTCGDGGESEAA